MTDLTQGDILEMLEELDVFVKNRSILLSLGKSRFGLKTNRKVKEYIEELERKNSNKSEMFELFLVTISDGFRYIINRNPNAEKDEIFKVLKEDKPNENDELEETEEDHSSFNLNSYGDYKNEKFRDYVYNKLAKYTLLIIENSYGDIEQAIQLISKENHIFKSLKHDFITHRDPSDITKIDLYAARLIFEVENLKEEKFEYEMTYDQLNLFIKDLIDIKDDFLKLNA